MGELTLYIAKIKSHNHHSLVDYKRLFRGGKVGEPGKNRLLIHNDVIAVGGPSEIQISVPMLAHCYYLYKQGNAMLKHMSRSYHTTIG